VGDFVILGGMTAVHQFCHIGSHAFTGGGAVVLRDIPPYVMFSGTKNVPQGTNSEGLKRRGFSPEQIKNVKNAYKIIYRQGNTLEEAVDILKGLSDTQSEIQVLVEFLKSANRGIAR
jgi:UDP-N-acetylglucosamine acyltransferase